MKKVETSFVCDDCGAPLPNEYIKTGVDEQYFDIRSYNSAHFPVNTDCFIHVHVGLNVVVDYEGGLRRMMKKMKLEDVPFGKNFEIWGHAYTVLDGDDKGVFVLEADAVCEMPFREENVESESAPNNFWDSSVRAYLEGDYLEELVEAGAELDRDILEMELDLKCTLGQHEYGVARVHAGLLTLEQYGKYYDIIPRIDTTYWLATPWKTPGRSPNTSYNANYALLVYTDGFWSLYYCSSSYGVRPTLTLSPSLLVSVSFTTREQVEKMRGKFFQAGIDDVAQDTWRCSRCLVQEFGNIQGINFCPSCGAPMTDKAVDVVMERLEEICK